MSHNVAHIGYARGFKLGERDLHAAGDATEMVSTSALVAFAIFRASTILFLLI